jgi:hypothetical protein
VYLAHGSGARRCHNHPARLAAYSCNPNNQLFVDPATPIGFNRATMAKPLVLSFGGSQFPFSLNKVERSDLYGFVEIETLDELGRKCTLATLADDGKSVIPSGGTAIVTLSPEGNWVEKKTLIPTDNQGQKIAPVTSSFSAPVSLNQVATIDEYLSHDIRAVYQLSCEADFGPLLAELKNGKIFQFSYSYRGGLEPDVGFLLLASDGTPFLAIGSPTKLEFVGFEQTAGVTSDEDGAEEEEVVDFGMM